MGQKINPKDVMSTARGPHGGLQQAAGIKISSCRDPRLRELLFAKLKPAGLAGLWRLNGH